MTTDVTELPALPADLAQRLPDGALAAIQADILAAGGPFVPPAEDGRVGCTMFDTPTSDDDTIPVLLPKENIGLLLSQAAVRIRSGDGRTYLGVVTRGPFALPDGLRPDAPPVVATAIRGGFFLPEYHGLVIVEIAGEEKNGQVQPHRFRPRPSSPVYVLDENEVRRFLKTGGNVRLGRAFGHEDLEIAFPAGAKEVLPRHTGILGTTGGGKSTTVANLIAQLQQAGVATILLDTEGEYTEMNEPTDDPRMVEILHEMGREPQGVPNTDLYFLVGRRCANPRHPSRKPFSPSFAGISPYAALEIFDLNEAQEAEAERLEQLRTAQVAQIDAFDRLPKSRGKRTCVRRWRRGPQLPNAAPKPRRMLPPIQNSQSVCRRPKKRSKSPSRTSRKPNSAPSPAMRCLGLG